MCCVLSTAMKAPIHPSPYITANKTNNQEKHCLGPDPELHFKLGHTSGITCMVLIRTIIMLLMLHGTLTAAQSHIMLQTKNFPVMMMRQNRCCQHDNADQHQYPCYVSSPFHRAQK